MGKKVKKVRVSMPEQPAEVRVKNFEEVPLGYTPEQAMEEANRCIQCKEPSCIDGCPVNIDIPGFLELVAQGKFLEAAQKVRQENCLPAVCGRVCPQETQCEILCKIGKRFDAVAIGRLERFVADFEREGGHIQLPKVAPSTGRKVAVVGSGPAGLTVAGDLAVLGHEVTIFEAFHKPGGVLMYGIPEFRLPKAIVEQEVSFLEKLGVRLAFNEVVGKTVTLADLLGKEGFDAAFIGVGAGLPKFMGIPGENLGGVYSANEYLTRSNLMKAYAFPDYDTPVIRGRHVSVIGGGNVTMDAARTAMRLGAESVHVLYRRGRQEMPARLEEIHHAEEEGIKFTFLCTPVEYVGDEKGMIREAVCQRMELGAPDASGRRRPVPVEGDLMRLETDLVIVAIGSNANPLLTRQTAGLKLNRWGNIETDDNGRTSIPNVWACGDIVTGSATVILAMGAGKKSAKDMHRYLTEELPAAKRPRAAAPDGERQAAPA